MLLLAFLRAQGWGWGMQPKLQRGLLGCCKFNQPEAGWGKNK